MNSLLTYFDIVAPHVPRALVSPNALAELRALQGRLPACDLAGFECRLGAAEPAVDLTVRVPTGAFVVPPSFRTHAAWRRVEALCAKLADRSSGLSDRVNVLDLEFDASTDALPVPAVLFELQRERPFGASEIEMLASELTGHPLAPPVARTLSRSVHALPAEGRIIHLGAMHSRRTDALRAVVSRVPSSALKTYLVDIGWTGDVARVGTIIDELSTLAGSITLSLDLGAKVARRVGIETFIDAASERDAKWGALLDWIVARGACTPEKAEAALSWAGVSLPGESGAWPTSLAWGDRLMRGRAATVFARFLSHLKIVIDEPGTVSAKAYFGFAHYWEQPAITAATAAAGIGE